MKKIIIVLLMIAVSATGTFAQVSEKKLSKAEKKALRKEKDAKALEEITALLNAKAWVIEAHTVYDRSNRSYQINPTLNFVAVKGEDGAIQLSFNSLVGWNGVGGITLDGKITDYEITESKKEGQPPTLSLRFQGRGGVGSARIFITVNSSSQATARYTSDRGERITFAGQILPLGKSTVYKGQSLF